MTTKQVVMSKQDLSREATDIERVSNTIQVIDAATREEAVQFCKYIKVTRERVEEVLGGQVKAAHAAWKTALDMKNNFMKPLDKADRVVRDKISDYEIAIEREEERLRQLAIKKQQQEEAKLLKSLGRKIDNARKKGNEDLAEQLELVKSDVVVPIEEVTPIIEVIAGKSSQDDYKIEVVNINKLLQAAVSGTIPIDIDRLVTIKIGALKAFVKATGTTRIPGCVVTKTKIQRIL